MTAHLLLVISTHRLYVPDSEPTAVHARTHACMYAHTHTFEPDSTGWATCPGGPGDAGTLSAALTCITTSTVERDTIPRAQHRVEIDSPESIAQQQTGYILVSC